MGVDVEDEDFDDDDYNDDDDEEEEEEDETTIQPTIKLRLRSAMKQSNRTSGDLSKHPKSRAAIKRFGNIYDRAITILRYDKNAIEPRPKTLEQVRSLRDLFFYETERQLSKNRIRKKRREELETFKAELVGSLNWSSNRFHPTPKMKFVAEETMDVLSDVMKLMNGSKDPAGEFNEVIYNVYTSRDRTTMGGSIVELIFVAALDAGLLKLKGVRNADIMEVHWVTMSKTDSNICHDCGLCTTKDQGVDVVVRLRNGTFRLVQIKYVYLRSPDQTHQSNVTSTQTQIPTWEE